MFNSNKTGIIGGVSIAKVKEILIPLPPQHEMNRIIDKIDELWESQKMQLKEKLLIPGVSIGC